jgi:hypothetical protein
LGVLVRVIPKTLSAGITAFNVGAKQKFATSENLPQSMVYGVALTPFDKSLVLALDAQVPKDEATNYKVGGEWWVNSIYVLRAGYDSSLQAGPGESLGVGICIKEFEMGFFPIERIMIDYAFTPAGDLDNAHRIALSFRFGLP